MVRRSDGQKRDVIFNKATFENADGNLAGLVGVILDITERKQAENKLQHYASELERSNRELEQFAYVASHDLQEPLRKVQTFSDRLKKIYGSLLDERGQDYLERMRSAAHRMQTMIDDLLSLSRVTTHTGPFVLTDLTLVANEIVSDFEMRVKQTGGRVDISRLPTIEADPVQMGQLLGNLIGNSLKFHRKEMAPIVRVHGSLVNPGGEQCRLSVEDNGIGFDEKYLERIFQPFQRLHGRGSFEGSGIGLATCRRIVERHGGSITARSQPNRGAIFMVTLPTRQLSQ
jgi:light-regulated signal transduction histidine kinase (bacteriophytochrome)